MLSRSTRPAGALPPILICSGMLLLGACASSGGGSESAPYRRDLGTQYEFTLEEARLKMWNRHGWNQVRRQSEYQNLYWESDWRNFVPSVTGVATDPLDARARIVIRGRRVQEQLGSTRTADASPTEGGVYRITFFGEYEVRGGMMGGDWRRVSPPEEVVELFDKVYDDMFLEVRTGVIRR